MPQREGSLSPHPDGSRALLGELKALSQASEGITHWARIPNPVDEEVTGSRFGVALSVLLQWI